MSMITKIDFDQSPDYVYIYSEGIAVVEGFDELFNMLVNSPRWKKGMKQLVDHSNLDGRNITTNDIQKIIGILINYIDRLGNGKVAIVAKNELSFGLIRMLELSSSENRPNEIYVFHDVDEAKKWLLP